MKVMGPDLTALVPVVIRSFNFTLSFERSKPFIAF